MLKVAGTDASKQFKLLHDETVMQKHGAKLLIGRVAVPAKL